MIFIATNADASDNNLGKISIKTIADVSKETYDVIAAYGNKRFTDDQIIAIDDFLIGLKNLSTYSRFTFFVLPILSPETSDVADNELWKDTNPCYDIIYKERLLNFGYNGYIGKYGLCKKGSYGNPPVIQLNEPISVNPNIYTIGVCFGNNQDKIGYLFNAGPTEKYCSLGASNKITKIEFTNTFTDTSSPVVTTASRNTTEAHAVRNGEIGVLSGSVNEPYATNPYSLEYAGGPNAYAAELLNGSLSFTFFCKDYMMTEDELVDVNKLCLDLMTALW